jgi:hypothetical protein
MKTAQPPDTAGRVEAWWHDVLAGQVDEPHPFHGPDLDVNFKGGVLRLSGELASDDDRKALLKEARRYVGQGVDKVDAKRLKVAKRRERPGILDQTLIAAFANRRVAELARDYLLESRRVEPEQLEILDPSQQGRAARLLPEAFLSDVEKSFKAGQVVLILRVDETSAFRVRELLADETRSLWTISTPPTPHMAATAG